MLGRSSWSLHRAVRGVSWASRSFCTPIDDPYAKVRKSKGANGETNQGVKDFNQLPGITSAREFLSFIQKSKLVADRPDKEVFYELIFGQFGDVARCDHHNAPHVLLGDADHIELASKKGNCVRSGSYYYNYYRKQRKYPIALMGGYDSDRDRYLEPMKKWVRNPKIVQSQLEPFKDITKQFINYLEPKLDQYTKVCNNLLPLCLMWNFECMVYLLFGQVAGALTEEGKLGKRFLQSQRDIGSNEMRLVTNPFAKWFPTRSWTRYTKGLDDWYGITKELMDADNEDLTKASLYKFLKSYKYSDGSQLTEVELMVLLSDVLNDATGNTPMTAVWLLHDVAKNVDVQEKITEEMKAVSYDVTKSPYLMAVVKESMRLHPTRDCSVVHVPKGGMAIGGYSIPPGVILNGVTSNTSLNPRYYEDPMSFKPERWLDESKEHHKFASCPYGIGPKTCPASDLGDLQLATFVQVILRRYLLDSDPDEVVEAQYQPLLAPIAPFDIAFNTRDSLPPNKKK